MKIAITAETDQGLDSQVAQHFGHAPFFVLVEVDNGAVRAAQTIVNPFAENHQPGEIPDFIKQQHAEVMLSGGMGGGPSSSLPRRGSGPPPARAARCANRWSAIWAGRSPPPRPAMRAWRTAMGMNTHTAELHRP